MTDMYPSSSSDTYYQEPQTAPAARRRKSRVNWHEAAACAIEIELRDYADILQFLKEYVLGRNSYRIDLLVIRKLSGQAISKNIARIFRTYNLFECKGIHSSLTVSSYYKTIGYAGLLVDQITGKEPCSSLDISITFLTFHYPRKLIRHLRKERHLTVEKISKGIYYINKETFEIQIIVTHELPPDENLYLCCLSDHLTDSSLINRLADDYGRHQGEALYTDYLHQLTTANTRMKGDSTMLICEGLLNLYGTSSEELIAKGKQEADAYYLPKINELNSSNQKLASQINHLEELLRQNNISFE